MTSRRASDGGSVLSFTFLDVLMCTMGSLLLLLVVFGVIAKKSRARREGEEAKLSLAGLTAPAAVDRPAGGEDPEATSAVDLSRELDRVRLDQAKLEGQRADAAQRRKEEEARIAHLEDHERRLEHELAKLHIALQALDAAEQKQVVDQEQADADVKRLKELVKETEARLADMRKNGAGQKSYAIVPYKGSQGTFRRPVFIECTADAVTIQPEGIRLTVEDFDGPLRSGNPLAAAIRAAHEELNGRAAAAGNSDMPDPYPLLIVRPDGAAAYGAALDAIRSWDSDYGYEFVEADWKLKYPDADPRLGQVMAHAVDEARQRQALLAKVAPRRYGPRLSVGGGGGGGEGIGLGGSGGGNADGVGGGFDALATGPTDRIGTHAGDGPLGGGDAGGNPRKGGGRYANGSGGGQGHGTFLDEFNSAEGGGQLSTNGTGGGAGDGSGGGSAEGQLASRRGSGRGDVRGSTGSAASGVNVGPRYGSPSGEGEGGSGSESAGLAAKGGQASGSAGAGGAGATGNGAQFAGAGGASGEAGGANGGGGGSSAFSASSSGASGAMAAAGGAAGQNMGAAPSIQLGHRRRGSAADTRGANWANAEASRHATAITRPIKIVVDADHLTLLDGEGKAIDKGVVTFQQPIDEVLDQLAGAIQTQKTEWGLAGDGMYWRPTLVVAVAPGAQRQAARLAELLENSGIDLRLPAATAQAVGGGNRVTK